MSLDPSLRQELRDGFRLQARVCEKAGAPVTAAILNGAGDEILAPGGVLDPILFDWTDRNPDAALSLRVLGALHRLALEGRAPSLAAILPSCGGVADIARAWPLARDVLAAEPAFIRAYLPRPPQTNEVGRSAMLLGGFLEIAAATGLPLRLFELGASAGLNLCWDRYRIESSAFAWGPADAGLTLTCDWDGPLPRQPADVRVLSRAGCDRNPADLRNPDHLRRLESYVWPDQSHRVARLRQATQIAIREGIRLDHEDAETWLPRQLNNPHRGATTVIYHSLFWPYLPEPTQSSLRTAIANAGARAGIDQPVAWLRMELPNMRTLPELVLTLWPSGETRTLATVHFHGQFVRWR